MNDPVSRLPLQLNEGLWETVRLGGRAANPNLGLPGPHLQFGTNSSEFFFYKLTEENFKHQT